MSYEEIANGVAAAGNDGGIVCIYVLLRDVLLSEDGNVFHCLLDTTCDISKHGLSVRHNLTGEGTQMTQTSNEAAFADTVAKYVQRVTTDAAYATEIGQMLQNVVSGTATYQTVLTKMAVDPSALSQLQPDLKVTPEWSTSVTTVTTATFTSPTTVTTTTLTTLQRKQ